MTVGCGDDGNGDGDGDVCRKYAIKGHECFPDYSVEYQQAQCESTLMYYGASYGQACAKTLEDYFACLSNADCGDEAAIDACFDQYGGAVETVCSDGSDDS